jgi:hypothetical protein
LEQAVKRAGARKILFGTDGPWLHPAVELSKVRALNLTATDERLVLGENLLRLISNRRGRPFATRLGAPTRTGVGSLARDPWTGDQFPAS